MPRPPRDDFEGAVHHVWARGVARLPIFRDNADRVTYLHHLGRIVRLKMWRCLSYCLMGNHVHLLVETPEANLAAGMQRLHSVYAQTFNERHGRSGHVFQSRYGSKLIRDDGQLWTAAAYIARNPVEAGLCAQPSAWRWSSHAAVVEGAGPAWLDAARLLEYFSTLGGDPLTRYRDAIAGGSAE